jgi:hypothetical protein
VAIFATAAGIVLSPLLTAFDPTPDGVASYAVCGRKASAAAPDMGFLALSVVALPLPVPEPSSALAAAAALRARQKREESARSQPGRA